MPFVLPALLAVSLHLVTPDTSSPTLATEDTMRTAVPEVLVRAPRITLEEILDRVARGEARRESLLTDQAFTVAVRMTRDVTGKRPPRLIEESVWRVFRKRPDKVRSVMLRRVSPEKQKKNRVQVEFSPGMGEEVVHFAFQPSARRNYRYRIVGRDLVGNHVIYRIAFEPKSALRAYEPSGVVWIDTNDFVIAREEVRFHQSPFPLLLRDINRMVVERQRVDGHWVLKRVVLRAEMTMPLPRVGSSFDLSVQYQDYTLNAGLDDALFDHTAGARR